METDVKNIYKAILKYQKGPYDSFKAWNKFKEALTFAQIPVDLIYPNYIRKMMRYAYDDSRSLHVLLRNIKKAQL